MLTPQLIHWFVRLFSQSASQSLSSHQAVIYVFLCVSSCCCCMFYLFVYVFSLLCLLVSICIYVFIQFVVCCVVA